jgi:hypothetical protein
MTTAYARLTVALDADEFRPRFDPILYSPDPNFFVLGSRLRWPEARHLHLAVPHG